MRKYATDDDDDEFLVLVTAFLAAPSSGPFFAKIPKSQLREENLHLGC